MTQMLHGLMQDDFPLTLNHIRRRLASYNPGAQVLTLRDDGSVARAQHAQVAERADRLARALARLAWRRAIAWRRSRGTTSATWSCTSPCRAWARCCTP